MSDLKLSRSIVFLIDGAEPGGKVVVSPEYETEEAAKLLWSENWRRTMAGETIEVPVARIMQGLAFLQLPMVQRNSLVRMQFGGFDSAKEKPPWLDDHVWQAAMLQGWVRRVGGLRSKRKQRSAGQLISTNAKGQIAVLEITPLGVAQLSAWKAAHPVIEKTE